MMAKKVFMEKKKLFTEKMNLEQKKIIKKCSIWSIALYAAETWMLTQTDRRRSEAFEMWIRKSSAGLRKLLMRKFSRE